MATILVVDDHYINREFLKVLLGYAGHAVIEAADGAEALVQARALQPQLVISDVLMPTMDGVEFARQLHADPAIASIPVIFYTAAYRLSEASAMGRSCGVSTVLAKPAEPQAVLDAVALALEKSSGTPSASAVLPKIGKLSPPPLEKKIAAYIVDLNALQQQLQLTVGHGQALLSGSGDLQRIAHEVSESLGTVQTLGLRLSALIELGLELSSEPDPQQLANQFCRAAQDVMNAQYAALWLIDSDGRVKHLASRGFSYTARSALAVLPPAGILAEVLTTGTPRRRNVVASELAALRLPASHPPIHTLLAVPIKSATRRYGLLYLANKLGASGYDIEDERIATTMATQFTLAYENRQLYEDGQQYASQLEAEIEVRKRAEATLRESDMKFRQLAENVNEVFSLSNPDHTQMLYVSPTYEKIWGRTCASLYAAPQSWADSIHPDDLEQAVKGSETRHTNGQFDIEYRIVRPDGAIRWIRSRGFPIHDDAGTLYRVAGISEDITESKQQQQKIDRLNRLYAVLSGINSAIVRIHDRHELFREACRIAVDEGTLAMAWVGEIDPDTLDGKVIACYGGEAGDAEKIRLTAQAGTPYSDLPASIAIREMKPVICNDIHTEPVAACRDDLLLERCQAVAALPLMLENRAVAVLVLCAREVAFFDEESELRLLNELAGDLSFALQFIDKEEKLSYLAYYDVLTGLPNHMLFQDRLTQYLLGRKNEQTMVATILIDLDHFSQVNDALGRYAGDMLLRQMVERLSMTLREPYSLARISGDKFAIALSDLQQSADALTVLEQQVFEPLSHPFMLDGHEIRVSARAGLALYPGDGRDAETLLKHAEVALKKAKSSGESYLYYAAAMNAAITAKLALESALQTALDARQFIIHYQARVDLLSGRIVGAEALIRWQHPQHGVLSPAAFIPLVEESGLIVPIGAWVIDTVCAQQAAWLEQQVEIVPVAVNLSAVQFKKGQVLQNIRDTIKLHGLEPKYIEFELTESVLMDDMTAATRNLQELKSLGVKLSLDDFGTGYSSLAYLKHFPFDFVKIDRAFVIDITRSAEDAAIATAIIAMAHSLNLRVVAEGVETEGQVHYLRKLHCDELQGYYFSRPVPASEFEALLRADKRLTLTGDPAQKAGTLLIVDDEPNNLSALKYTLEDEGYHVLMASSGQEGLDLLAVNEVQVIVSDHRMPGMTGSEFLSIVKELYPDTMRIILSGYIDREVVTDSLNRGAAFKLLPKPCNSESLREHIRDAFRRYRH